MAHIKPTVGRVVLLFNRPGARTEQPEACLVAYVHSDRLVNLGGFDANGVPFGATSVPLEQEGDPNLDPAQHAEWMPYQRGQAAKTEALEQQLKAGGTQ